MFVENSRYIWTSVHLCQWNSAVWDCPKQWVLYHQTVFRFCDKKKKKREEWRQLDQLFGHEDSQLQLVPLWKASTDSGLRQSPTQQRRVWDVLVLIEEKTQNSLRSAQTHACLSCLWPVKETLLTWRSLWRESFPRVTRSLPSPLVPLLPRVS